VQAALPSELFNFAALRGVNRMFLTVNVQAAGLFFETPVNCYQAV
jgi:hypothetical protein